MSVLRVARILNPLYVVKSVMDCYAAFDVSGDRPDWGVSFCWSNQRQAARFVSKAAAQALVTECNRKYPRAGARLVRLK